MPTIPIYDTTDFVGKEIETLLDVIRLIHNGEKILHIKYLKTEWGIWEQLRLLFATRHKLSTQEGTIEYKRLGRFFYILKTIT